MVVNILFLTSFSLVADLRRSSQRLVLALSATREKRVYLFISSTFTSSNSHSCVYVERVVTVLLFLFFIVKLKV